MDILSFCLIAIAIIIIPGPNVLVIVSTSMAHGKTRGLQTVAGTSCAMIIQLAVAALGTAWLVSLLSYGLTLLKWAGVVYLFYLAIQQGIAFFRNNPIESISASYSFKRGFWVSLTNPKPIIFFSAFLPQFVDVNQSYLPQIVLLSAVFLLLAAIFDSLCVLLTSHLKHALGSAKNNRYQHGLSALIYFLAGSLLATSRISQQ